MGGWPQRFPPAATGDGTANDCPDYARLITLNDDVAGENLALLNHACALLDEPRLVEPIRRGMDAYLLLQQPAPQAGWALQYTIDDLKPAPARSYEPAALATNATVAALDQLLIFHELTGDARYLEPIPRALAWLESVRLPPESGRENVFPTFVEPGTNQTLFLHRTGSNVVNGRYFADHEPANQVGHYGSVRRLDVTSLRERYEQARSRPIADPAPPGGLRAAALPRSFPRVRSGPASAFLERYAGADNASSVARIVADLNAEGYWPTPLWFTSHPYTGDGSPAAVGPHSDYGRTFVGDQTDTSPYRTSDPVVGISIASYLRNLRALLRYLEETEP